MTILGLTAGVQAQLTISDDFDDGNDLGWTAYEGGPGTREVRFHDGQYQIINHGSFDESGIFTRGASIRNDATYSGEFFVATDVVGWAPKETIGFAGPFILARVTTPGSLTTFGYLTTVLPGGPLSPQSLMGFVEFQSELQATGPDQYTGGTVLTAALDPAKGYRYVFHSGLPADLGGLLIAELYDLTDLLEPVARGVARDDLNNASHTSGVSGIGNFQVGEQDTADWTGTADTTFDNFYASPNSNNFVGFINVPQVVNLAPGVQTLFYTIPVTNQITFTASTFGTNICVSAGRRVAMASKLLVLRRANNFSTVPSPAL